MIKAGMLLICLFALSAQATEFQHIKITPKFQQYLTGSALQSGAAPRVGAFGSKSLLSAGEAPSPSMLAFVRQTLLGSKKKSFAAKLSGEGEESPVYQEIRDQLQASHKEIGLEEVTRIDRLNREFNMGSENFSGFNWQKPFGTVQVYVNRQVTPNLESEGPTDRWLVEDAFTIEVEATTFLEKLKEAGMVEATMDIGAFAGITFKRVYNYSHYAPSYQQGLSADFTKLFLPFLYFNTKGLEIMGDRELLKRNDLWSASVGGLITSPPWYGASFSAGVLAEYAHEQSARIQNFKTTDPSEQKVILVMKNKTSKNVAATASLQLDFFKLIKLTLMTADLTYEYSSGKEFMLSLNGNQWTHMKSDAAELSEFQGILGGKSDVKELEPYVIALNETSSSSLQAHGSVLLWGALMKTNTEQNRIIKDGNVHVFYKNHSYSTRYVQSFWSRLLSAVAYNLLKLPLGTKNVATYTKEMKLEYKVDHPQAENPKIVRVNSPEQFSFSLKQSYEAASIHKSSDSDYKKDVLWFVDEFTTIKKDYLTMIRRGEIIGPIRIDSDLKVDHAGFKFLVAQNINALYGSFAKVCKSGSPQDWIDPHTRRELLRETQSGPENCVKLVGRSYEDFKKDYDSNHFKPSLKKFKDFLSRYYKVVENVTDLNALFGLENTFLVGQMQAKLPNGATVQVPFHNGEFRGNGVIDNFKRFGGSRTPATTISE